MADFNVDDLFSSYDELKEKIDEYQKQHSIELRVRDSRTLEAARKRFPNRVFSEELKYYELRFACVHSGKNFSKSKEDDCEMSIRLVVTRDGNYLQVKKLNETHNHPLGNNSDASGEVQQDVSGKKSKRHRQHNENIDHSYQHEDTTPTTVPRRKKRRNTSLSDTVNLGKQLKRWQTLKEDLNLYSDEDLAEFLLNRLEANIEILTPREESPRPSFLSNNQLSTMSTQMNSRADDHNQEAVKNHNNAAAVASDEDVSANQEECIEVPCDTGNNENYSFTSNVQTEVEPVVVAQYLPRPSPLIMRKMEQEPLHECQENQNGERSDNILPLIGLGKQYNRWTKLKEKLQIETDEDMAKFLLDH